MANFIHSMDAANIHYLIKLITSNPKLKNQGVNLYTIHDCFASVNDQMDLMEKLVRKAFSQLYFEKNYLIELDRCLLSQIKSYGVEIQISNFSHT
jgi:DNA-directed RNA polymerase